MLNIHKINEMVLNIPDDVRTHNSITNHTKQNANAIFLNINGFELMLSLL